MPIPDALQDALAHLALPHGARLHVVVNDPARATPTGSVLDALLEARPDLRLEGTVACGTHVFDAAQRAAHVTRHGLARLAPLRWHGPTTPASVPDAVAALGVGSVEPHYFAGWTGAHKTLSVGLWDRARIEANHAGALDVASQPCALRGNPVFDDVAAALEAWMAARAAPCAAVDLLYDAQGVHAAAGGRPLATLEALLERARARFVQHTPRPLDRLVARVAPPLDASLYQALKGVHNHEHAVRDGGALILCAPCPEGVGIDHFMATLEAASSVAATRAHIAARGYRLGDHKALRLRRLQDERGVQLGVVAPGIDEAAARVCRARRFDALDAALAWARRVAPGIHERVVDDAAHRVTRLAP